MTTLHQSNPTPEQETTGVEASEPSALRSVVEVVPGVVTLEGEGFQVRRPFPTRTMSYFDPFLLLDELGPVDLGPNEAKGASDHPHRGFETVTYILDGALVHKDSQGNTGLLRPGDVQWMTAGSGVVHSEMPEESFKRTGGRMHGFQLWVNLPRADKMIHPRYQDMPTASIPVAQSADGSVSVKVIAGEALGAEAVIDTRTPIMYLHFTLQPGAEFSQVVPRGYNSFAYVVNGTGYFGTDPAGRSAGNMVIFDNDGDVISFAAAEEGGPLDLLLLAGVPLNEPVARYGPFVMNTRDEIIQAVTDYQEGRMGSIA